LISTGMELMRPLIMGEDYYYLDCASKYPTPLISAGWDGFVSGLSDHSGTVWPGLDAICRGAKFLEVHFCADTLDPGNDGPVCLNFDQLKLLCDMRNAKKEMT
jgi:sialic acid synthase SpsE